VTDTNVIPMKNIRKPDPMKRLSKALSRLERTQVAFAKAHSQLHDDRNLWAGKIYEAQKEVNEAAREATGIGTVWFVAESRP